MVYSSVQAAQIPLKSAARLVCVPREAAGRLAEIRLRTGRPAAAVTFDGEIFCASQPLSKADLEGCFEELCRFSVHSFAQEIAEGYITLDGGHRVGFCGTAVLSGGRLSTLRDISSLNVRIAHEIRGCADEIFPSLFLEGICSVIVGGKPLSGKTTVLRDLARRLGERHNVALIDSRNEISATVGGVPTFDIGRFTDVLTGYPREEGMMCALRSLSPEVIICDEIGNDVHAVRQCMNSGVKLIVSAHCANASELRCGRLSGIVPFFDRAVILGKKGSVCEMSDLALFKNDKNRNIYH